MPKGGFHGVPSVLSSVDGLKKFVDISASPYHGLNFCQGTVCEMLDDPAREIPDVIRYFGSRKKIFNVHFRNIVGPPAALSRGVSRRRRHQLPRVRPRIPRGRLRRHVDA